jgi:hypothetical protein
MPDSPHSHPLPAERAFVLQLSADAEIASRRLAGRVEHVTSGESTHFQSLEQLLGFLAALTDGTDRHAEEPSRKETER